MEVRPIHQWECLEDRIIIKPDDPPKVTEGGLIIPDSVQEQMRPAQGTIILTGPGIPTRTYHELIGYSVNGEIKPELADGETGEPLYRITTNPLRRGDRIKYSKQAGLPVQDPNTKEWYLIMRFSDAWVRV